jgi:5-methylcytosine-specific restriction endonuclease McrA
MIKFLAGIFIFNWIKNNFRLSSHYVCECDNPKACDKWIIVRNVRGTTVRHHKCVYCGKPFGLIQNLEEGHFFPCSLLTKGIL